MLAVIRVRGKIKIRKDIEDTLELLRLNRKMHCILLNETDSIKGMLQKVKDYVTWGKIDDDTLRLLVSKRGRKPGNKRIPPEEIEYILKEIKQGKKLIDIGLVPVFRLTPPSKGFRKSIKQHYPNGELGNRKEKINELLKRMI